MHDDATQVETWGDLRVGDRVRQVGPGGRRMDTFVVIELRSAASPVTGEPDAVAMIQDARGETYVVNVRQICRI